MPARYLALVGNPNTGKSTLFNALTGLNQRIGNFPGVTIDRRVGTMQRAGQAPLTVLDLPGVYGLYPRSEDERITCRVLQDTRDPDHPDTVLVVADAANLRPGLLLCSQVCDLGLRVVFVIHRADLVEQSTGSDHTLTSSADPAKNPDIARSDAKLSRQLGVPVVRVSSREGWGLSELKRLLARAIPPPSRGFFTIPEGLHRVVAATRELLGSRTDYAAYQQLLIADSRDDATGRVAALRAEAGIARPAELIENEVIVRYDRLADLLERHESQAIDRSAARSAAVDRVLMHPVFGYVILLGILLMVFQSIFSWAAYPMEWIDGGMASLGAWLARVIPDGFIQSLLVGGIFAGIQGVVIFVPQIALLFFFIALLEETGYMSRVVFLMDRLVRPFGISGKSVVPLFGGFACAVPSIMAVRSIPHKSERLLAILMIPLMSCSARIPVYTVLIALFVAPASVWGVFDVRGLVMAGFYGLGIVVALLLALATKGFVRSSGEPLFVTELPNFRQPRWSNIGREIVQKVRAFVFDAGKVIVLISVVLWVLASYGPPAQMDAVVEQHAAQRVALGPKPSPDSLSAIGRSEAAAKLQTSWAGQIGRTIEPALAPMGYDWKIGISILCSFAAREVFVATMNTLYAIGEDDTAEGYGRLTDRLRAETNPTTGKPVYTAATALSLLVFYALALQCMSTLAVIKRETGSWRWVALVLIVHTGLAYVLATATYQLFA
jgi:ferrous iron transport protein B